MIEPCELRRSILDCPGHALVIGGPGSGKTTIALRKAVKRIREGLTPGQSALFISFTRAAVARILDASKLEASKAEREQLSIQTFHSFFWDILKSHGYLLGAPDRLTILMPQDEKALSGGLNEDDDGWDEWLMERERLFREEGRVAFDLFAPNATALLTRSSHLLSAITRKHPIIIVDEAQDTGDHAWQCVNLLAPHAQIVCLADLEQQIFDYLPGVGPERVDAIRLALQPHEVDLGFQNHRSPGTEILAFGNDILSGTARGAPYAGVSSIPYRPENPPPNWNHLLRRALSDVYKAVQQRSGERARSIAILVANNKSALKMSNALNALGTDVGKPVRHKLMFDESEALLSARLAAYLLEPSAADATEVKAATCIEMIAKARRSTGKARAEVERLFTQAQKIRNGTARRTALATSLRLLITELRDVAFSGDPAADWLRVKHVLRASGEAHLLRVATQLDFLVAFQRGHRISGGLAAEWLRDGAYTDARNVLDTALAQEQILDGIEPIDGVQVMNFHKSKGKQFDGVILVREVRRSALGLSSSFVWRGDMPPYPKSRRVLRVGITRAQTHVLLMNPLWPPCPLIAAHAL